MVPIIVPIKMVPIVGPETPITGSLRCVTSQKSKAPKLLSDVYIMLSVNSE